MGLKNFKGETKIRKVKTRVNQSVFRQMILANYSTKCAVSGIDVPELLLVSHIVPWSKDENEWLNPENSICLSALYDKGLIGINQKYQVILSTGLKKKIKSSFYQTHFGAIENLKITEPIKYLPRKEILEYHMDTIFNEKEIRF